MTLLLSVTLTLAAGLLVGLREPVAAWGAAVVCAVALVLLAMKPRRAALITFAGIGIALGSMRASDAAGDCREQLWESQRVRVTGVPRVVPTMGVTLALHVDSLTADGVRCTDIELRVRAAQRHHAVLDSAARTGSAVTLQGRWMTYARRNGWPRPPEYAGAVLIDAIRISNTAPRAGVATRLRMSQQRRLRAMLPDTWGLAESLLLAERAGITPEIRMRWVSSGLVHLLAISGMHVGMIAAGALLICSLLRVPPRTARRVAILISTAYVLFLGAPSAALRSLLQAVLLLLSIELQRPAEPFTALAAAALVIILLEPLAILDAGFQLSFAGMVGLVAWRRPIANTLPRRLHPHVRDGLASGIAATALTTPIAALHFGTISWIGIPATIVAAPLFAAALALLVAALAVAALTGATTGPHAWIADLVLGLLDRIAAFAAAVPGGHGYIAWTTVLYALAAAVVAILVRAAHRTSQRPPSISAPEAEHAAWARRFRIARLRTAIAVSAALVLVAWAPLVLRPHDGRIEIHAVDVGQGDAFAIRTPAGRWLLVDTGPRTARMDAGRDRVVPYLLRHGTRRIDALILTHPDADHIGGAEAILDAFDVDVVVDPGLAAGKDMFIDLLSAARSDGARWIAGRAGIAFTIDGVRVTLLYPVTLVDDVTNANDYSVVFRLEYGEFAALFLGDAPQSVEAELVARYGERLAAHVLKVGHHGSATSTGADLLRTVRPRLALVSVGRYNRYGHPNPGVLDRLADFGVRVLRTDLSGSFVVRAGRDGDIEVLAR